jgi:glycine/serine hydroxymethyltransferase
MTPSDMDEIADLIALTLSDFAGSTSQIKDRVAALCSRYPLYEHLQ